MSPRPDPVERKEAILRAALTVFAEKGFHQATMDDIVVATGLSKGGLYWHFKSKNDIIQAILERFFDEEMALLSTIAGQSGPVTGRLRLLIDTLSADLVTLDALLPITFEFYAVASRDAGTRSVLRAYFDRYQALLAGLVAEGSRSGEFRPVDGARAALALLAQLEGMILLWSVMEGALDLSAQLHASLDIFLEGLHPRAALPPE